MSGLRCLDALISTPRRRKSLDYPPSRRTVNWNRSFQPQQCLFVGVYPSCNILTICAKQSGNPYQQPPPDPSRHQTAHGFVRFILDARHRPSTSFIRIPEDRPSVLEEYAQLLTEARDSADISAAQAASPTSMSSGSDRDLRRRFNRDPQLSDNALPSIHSLQNPSLPAPPSLPPLRWLGSRARPSMAAPGESGGRSSRYRPRPLERHRAGGESRSSSNIPDMMRSLDDANTHHRTLLDLTTSSSSLLGLGSPPPAPPFHDQTEESRRIKRRKLDSDRLTPTFKGFRYGRYGQVEPGQLTMEIVSCDGGLYEGLPQNANYAAENILKNDDSVYCTKGNRCNIILRHQGATVFSLKELVIKAPGSNYSSPYVFCPFFQTAIDRLQRPGRNGVCLDELGRTLDTHSTIPDPVPTQSKFKTFSHDILDPP